MSRQGGRSTGRPGLLALAACLLALAMVAAVARAAAGQLDTSFSGDGKRVTDFNAGMDEAAGVAIQPGGKIVVVGNSFQTDANFAVARYRPNGSLDTSFSGDGKRSISFLNGTNSDEGDAVAVQPDGKIVVVGNSDQGVTTGSDFAIARLRPNGDFDSSFSGDGKQVTSFDNGDGLDEAQGIAIQEDGKIVVAGESFQGAEKDFAVARYRPNGSLDTSFSGDGKQITSFGPGSNDEGSRAAIQGDGKIVVVGNSDKAVFAVARFRPSGSLDTSFSSDGKRTVSFGTGADEGEDVALQPDGKIVVAGGTDVEEDTGDFALARLRPNGSLDPGFAGDGKRTTTFGAGEDNGHGVTIQANGRIVVAGGAGLEEATAGGDFAVARYRPNGSLDTSFAGDGKRITSFGPGEDEGEDVAIQANGRIVVAGLSEQGAGTDFAIARFLAN